MKTFIPFALLFCLANLTVYAQNAEDKAYKNSIGLDIQSIFGDGAGTEIQYERYLGGLFARAAIGFSARKSEDSDLSGSFSASSSDEILLRAGLGHRFTFDKFRFQLGSDLSLIKVHSETTRSVPPAPSGPLGIEQFNNTNITRAGIQPFIGMGYQISKRFSIRAEAYSSVAHFKQQEASANNGNAASLTQEGWNTSFFSSFRFFARVHF